jgi:hypothetical protein
MPAWTPYPLQKNWPFQDSKTPSNSSSAVFWPHAMMLLSYLYYSVLSGENEKISVQPGQTDKSQPESFRVPSPFSKSPFLLKHCLKSFLWPRATFGRFSIPGLLRLRAFNQGTKSPISDCHDILLDTWYVIADGMTWSRSCFGELAQKYHLAFFHLRPTPRTAYCLLKGISRLDT